MMGSLWFCSQFVVLYFVLASVLALGALVAYEKIMAVCLFVGTSQLAEYSPMSHLQASDVEGS